VEHGKILEAEKDGKSLDEDNLNSQLQKYAGESFHDRLLLAFNTIYMRGESPEEWRNFIVDLYTRNVVNKG